MTKLGREEKKKKNPPGKALNYSQCTPFLKTLGHTFCVLQHALHENRIFRDALCDEQDAFWYAKPSHNGQVIYFL